MGIPLGQAAGPPGIKFRTFGQFVDVAIVNVEQKPLTDYVTGAQLFDDESKPRMQDVVTGLVIRGDAAITVDDADTIPEAGRVVTIWCASGRRYDFIQAQKKLDGQMMVGDIMRVTYDREEPGQGASPKKVWTFQIRHPKPEESEQTERCEALNRALDNTAAPSPAYAGGAPRDEAPF